MLCNKQLNHIGKSFNTAKERSNDAFLPTLHKTSIVIPSIVQSVLIGNRGVNIRKLQTEFGVKMRLMGDNWLDYPNGRTLQILGDSEEKIFKARKYIDEEYILKKWEAMNIGQRLFTTAEDEQNIVYREVIIPKILTTRSEEDMAKMQKNSGIIEYLYRDSKQDGMRIIILRGTKDSVTKAEKELGRLTEHIPRKANSVSSFGDETIVDAKHFILPQHNLINNSLPKSSQKIVNSHQSKNVQHSLNQKLFAYSPPPLQHPNLAKLRINNVKNVDVSVSAFSMQSSVLPGKHLNSVVHPTHGNKNDFMVDSGIGSPEFPQKQRIEYIHRNSKLNNSKSSTTSDEKYEAEIRELRSENEKLKRQVALKDRELVRLNCVRSCFGCNSAQRSIIFFPCAHFLFCVECAERNEICLICNLPRGKKLVKYG